MAWSVLVLLLLPWLVRETASLGSLPDASQEGLLEQFSSYASLAVFHYTVPPEISRATWEFASFQDRPNCPRREAVIHIQQGSFPVFSADNSSFPKSFYLKRTGLASLRTTSDFQPSDSAVHPVYNPEPGSWFAVAYLSPYEQEHGLLRKCRYSLGSVALWSRVENMQLILPNVVQTFRTQNHFSYFKFFVHDDVDAFKLVVSNCVVRVRHPRPEHSARTCIDFVDLRAKALPFHTTDSETARLNISSSDNVTFIETRPHKATTYYVIVVSHGEVSFDVELRLRDCGENGLYGKQQRDWYLSERGLMWSETYNASQPKEPENGFQLFSLNSDARVTAETSLGDSEFRHQHVWTADENDTLQQACYSTFDFTRIENVAEFNVNYLLQGRSWYTKWLTVLEASPLMTRFETLDFLDLGGFVNINLVIDDRKKNRYMYQSIVACLSKDRQPDMNTCHGESLIEVSDRDNTTKNALKVIPYPEPGKWYLGFQLRCIERKSRGTQPCPRALRAAMVSVDLHIQPCGYRPLNDICGEYGVCAKATKGRFRYSACTCLSGRKGWTCDDSSEASKPWVFLVHTILLTVSNLCFLPAVVLALWYGLLTEALLYTATMIFSTFYHLCDQEALTMTLPFTLEKACLNLYVNREVLQFCDFYSATLSFWITIISLARLPHRLVNFLHMLGVLLIAVLVQYNRSSLLVLLVPIPLGLLILFVALQVKGIRRRKLLRPNKLCTIFLLPATVCSVFALCLVGFFQTTLNYPYVHSVWHLLMASSLIFLLPRCKLAQSLSHKQHHVPARESSTSSLDNSASMTNSMTSETEITTCNDGDEQKSDESSARDGSRATQVSVSMNTISVQ